MPQATIQVFRVAQGSDKAESIATMSVDAETHDRLAPVARARLTERFGRVRSLTEGPHGFVAYVEIKQ